MPINMMYNSAFCNNAASVFMHKSERKNAKCSDVIKINHLRSHTPDKKASDERILQQFVETLEKVVYTALKFNRHIEITVRMDSGKNSTYVNTYSELYHTTEYNYIVFDRLLFSSIEQCINFLYTVYCLMYPYNELNLNNTVYNNASVKHLINLYYKGVA